MKLFWIQFCNYNYKIINDIIKFEHFLEFDELCKNNYLLLPDICTLEVKKNEKQCLKFLKFMDRIKQYKLITKVPVVVPPNSIVVSDIELFSKLPGVARKFLKTNGYDENQFIFINDVDDVSSEQYIFTFFKNPMVQYYKKIKSKFIDITTLISII